MRADAFARVGDEGVPLEHVVSPIRKMKRYNLPDPKKPILEYFGEELLPTHLFPRGQDLEGLHSCFYRETGPGYKPYVWMPVLYKDGLGKTFGIYYTVANRMDYLERLLGMLEDNAPNEVRQSLLEIQDRYQLLSLHMELSGEYEDSNLTKGICPPISKFYPAQDKVFSIEELPDLHIQTLYCKFWGDKMDVPFSDPATLRLIGVISKALPSPCKGRSVTTILPDLWKDDNHESDIIFDCIMRIALGGLFGVYPHCGVTANFRTRRALYRWGCLTLPKEAVGDWIRKNKYLIIYVLREYAFYLISSMPSLDEYMNRHYYWHHMKKNTYEAMDEVRRHANTMLNTHAACHPMVDGDGLTIYEQYLEEECYFYEREDPMRYHLWFPGRSWFDGISGVLASYNKSNLDFCHRPIESSFLDAVLSIVREIDDSKYSSEAHRKIEKEFSKDDEVAIFSLVCEGLEMDKQIDYKWLSLLFKVRLDSIEQLTQAERLYMRETSRSKIQLLLKDLAENRPRDYHVIKLFFFALEKKMSVIFYDLPEHLTKKQIESFFKMYDTVPGHALDENAGVYYYCPNCGELKARVVPSDSKSPGKKDKERECTIAFERISVNMITGEKTCAKPASKSSPKKRSVSSDAVSEIMGLGTDQRKESKKQSKDSRKRKTMEKCQSTKLIKFTLIGKIMRTEKWGLIIICPWCLCLTTLGRESYKYTSGEVSCGCMRSMPPIDLIKRSMLKCAMCSKELEDERPILHLVFDDVTTPNAPIFRYVVFCKHHKTASSAWIEKWDSVLRLSQIRQGLKEGWRSIRLGEDGGRVFIAGSQNKRYRQNGWKPRM